MIFFLPDIFSQPFQFYVLHQMMPCFPFATILPHSSLSDQIFLRGSLVHIYNCLSKALGTRFDSEIRFFGLRKALTSVVWSPQWNLGQHPLIITLLFLHWNVWLSTLNGINKGYKKLHFSPGQVLLPNELKQKTLIFQSFWILELCVRDSGHVLAACFLTFFFLTHSGFAFPHFSQMVLANSTNDLYLKESCH